MKEAAGAAAAYGAGIAISSGARGLIDGMAPRERRQPAVTWAVRSIAAEA